MTEDNPMSRPFSTDDSDMEDDEEYSGDGWCMECLEEFRMDDVGGYFPPCPCGCGMCRECCRAEKAWEDGDERDYYDDDELPSGGTT